MATKLAKDGARLAGERIANQKITLPVITACKMVTYIRIGIKTKRAEGLCYTSFCSLFKSKVTF
jgi:hypothetical protein